MNSLIFSRFNDEWNWNWILIDFISIISMLKDLKFIKYSISHKKSKYFHLIYHKSFWDNLTDFLDFDFFFSFILLDNYQFNTFLNMMRYNKMKLSIKVMNSLRDEIWILKKNLVNQRKYWYLFLINS